jgi:hypothetical protein
MRYLPFLLLLGLLSCDRDALAPNVSLQADLPTTIHQSTALEDNLHPSITSSNWWKEMSPAVRQFIGPELSSPTQPVTLRQLESRMQQAANRSIAKGRPAACGGFPAANPEGDVTLNSQADVDAFGAMNCKAVAGALEIIDTLGPDPIVDLSPLSKLKSVGSSLTINGDGLTDLSGLKKLKTIGLDGPFGFIGVNGANLTDISDLSNLKTITGSINIINCDALISVSSAFSKLKVIAPGQTPESITSIFTLNINDNSVLTDLSGFSGLTTMDALRILSNGALTDLDDLSSLNTVVDDIFIVENTSLQNVNELDNITSLGEDLFVFDNPALSICCGLYGLLCADPPTCTANNVGGNLAIFNNGPGCAEADVIAGSPCP